jgi:hypothetical protein
MNELKTIFIDQTEKTPQIDFNFLTGELILSGKSIPENATAIYEPAYNWVTNYIKNPRQTTNLRLNLEYFNTASSIWLVNIVKCLSKIEVPESVLLVHLYFNIEEFDNMDVEDVKDALSYVVDIVNPSTISVGIKLYGTDEKGRALKESMVLI